MCEFKHVSLSVSAAVLEDFLQPPTSFYKTFQIMRRFPAVLTAVESRNAQVEFGFKVSEALESADCLRELWICGIGRRRDDGKYLAIYS